MSGDSNGLWSCIIDIISIEYVLCNILFSVDLIYYNMSSVSKFILYCNYSVQCNSVGVGCKYYSVVVNKQKC